MSAAWIIYFASISGKLSFIFLGIGFVTAFISFIFLMASEGEKWKASLKGGIVATLLFVISILLPSQETVYLIAGAKVTQDIVQSPEAKELGGKVLKIINTKLDEQIKDKK